MRIFKNANIVFAKRRKNKKTRLQDGKTFIQKKSKFLLAKKNKGKYIISNNNKNANKFKKIKQFRDDIVFAIKQNIMREYV